MRPFNRLLIAALFLPGCAQLADKDSLSLDWRTNLGYGSRLQLRHQYPVYYDDRLYFCDKNKLLALDATNGKRLWQRKFPATLNSCLGRFADILYFTDNEGAIYAFNIINRELLWQLNIGESSITAPVANEQVVLIVTLNEHLYALNSQDGTILWSYQAFRPPLTLFGSFRPLIVGPYSIVGFGDGALVIHNWQEGRLISYHPVAVPQGKTDLERLVDLDGSAVFDGGVLYVPTSRNSVLALDLQLGTEQWRAQFGSQLPLAYDGQTLYGVNQDNELYALTKEDGKTLWLQNDLSGRRLTAPTLWQDNIALGDNKGYLYLFSSQDGSQLAKRRMGVVPFNPILLATDDRLILLDTEGNVFAFKP